ncbi:MAG: hypothetical protein IPN94_06190 [Sphingobacteriales bacterium]|nr:hypothetical protein [Sphingobacteriales bacterium]
MKISKFQFEDKSLEWRLEELLLNKLTLLVGASGVGKTQILRALMTLKQITKGSSINGVAWLIEFTTLDKCIYKWEGSLKIKVSLFLLKMKKTKKIKKIKQKLFLKSFI